MPPENIKASALACVAEAYTHLLTAQKSAAQAAAMFGGVCRDAYEIVNDREMSEITKLVSEAKDLAGDGFSRARIQQYRKKKA